MPLPLAGYRFRYLCLRGAFFLFGNLMSWVSFSIPVFAWGVCLLWGGFPLLDCRVSFSIPVLVWRGATPSGGGFPTVSWVSFSIPVFAWGVFLLWGGFPLLDCRVSFSIPDFIVRSFRLV